MEPGLQPARAAAAAIAAEPRSEHLYASLVRCDWVDGRPRQTTVAYLGRVEEDQVPFLKAAYAKRKPRLVWDDE